RKGNAVPDRQRQGVSGEKATRKLPRFDTGSCAWRVRKASYVRVNHHLDECREVDLWSPTQSRSGLGSIADEVIHFGGTQEFRIEPHVPLPIEIDPIERDFHQLS